MCYGSESQETPQSACSANILVRLHTRSLYSVNTKKCWKHFHKRSNNALWILKNLTKIWDGSIWPIDCVSGGWIQSGRHRTEGKNCYSVVSDNLVQLSVVQPGGLYRINYTLPFGINVNSISPGKISYSISKIGLNSPTSEIQQLQNV